MKLSPQTWARTRPQLYPMESAQPELPHMPPPMTVNRAKDFNDHECRQCKQPCGYRDELHD